MTKAQKILESVSGVKSTTWDKNTLIFTVTALNHTKLSDLKSALQKGGFDARLTFQ